MAAFEDMREAQRARGAAAILAIGTANPTNIVYQSDFADYYLRMTNNEHNTELGAKLKRICDRSMIRKRHFHLNEKIIKENPNLQSYDDPSLNKRQEMLLVEVPKLAEKAALKAIKEWGRPKSEITHLIFCTTVGVDIPGADYQLLNLLGLKPSTKRFMLYQQGCFAGGTVLRLAKDLAENNAGARVLTVNAESTITIFRGHSDSHMDSLVGQAIFADGASSVIVGCNPDPRIERPIFHIVGATQTILPDSEGTITGHLREVGLTFHLRETVPKLIGNNIEKCLEEAFYPLGVTDWNSLFWVTHPGGPAILKQIEERLKLNPDRMRATYHVLSEYGNMSSACVGFILDEMRKRSVKEGKSTTGDGLKWGVLQGFGPGLTMETITLCSTPLKPNN